LLFTLSLAVGAGACASSSPSVVPDAGPTGGSSSGGVSGGSGGAASGGTQGSGGAASGGAPASTGGAPASGGSSGGGISGGSGGRGTGGAAGGAATGGAANGGTTGSGGAAGGATGFGYGGPSRCATAGLPFCEDFESGSLNTATWTTTRNGDTTIAVDTTKAARGTHALHIKTTAGDWAYIKETKSFPATNNILHGRMFVWFEDDITTDGHFSLAEGAGTGTPGVSRFGGQFKVFGVGSDGGPSGDWTNHDDTKKVVSKTWICAEFQFKGDTHEFKVWWDDVERTAARSGPAKYPNFVMPTFNSLWFGWWMYNIKEPQELWIDEIAVDYKPIGCTK
jgi:hypothetical protein